MVVAVDNYDCQVMPSRDPLDIQLGEIAWSQVSRRWRPPDVVPADPQDYDASDADRRAGCLGLLWAYTRMIKLLQRRIDRTVDAALSYGASYGQVATVTGVSRQAVRQRRLRHQVRQTQTPDTQPPAAPINEQEGDERDSMNADSVHPAPRTHSSDGASPNWAHRGRSGANVRVYELAREFGVDSTAVLARLQDMGEFVRSASSTVEISVVRKLRDKYGQQSGGAAPGQP